MAAITKQIRHYVESECKNPSNKYGYEPYINHFVPTVKFAKILARKLSADEEIVELAAWLHDIGSIVYGRENHHVTSAEIAGKKLHELNYPESRIKQVQHCIFSHRGSQNIKRETIEAKILADADAMNVFDHIEGQFYAAFISEKLNQEQARKSVLKKVENSYNKLSPEARAIIKPKYKAIKILL